MNLANVRIVLVRPQHPGNIGACARAMKNMGLQDLVLVAPRPFSLAEAKPRAAGADDVLVSARTLNDVRAAVADCALVVATSARARTIAWPNLTPRSAAAALGPVSRQAPVTVLFGAERTGLTNEELDFAHALVRIPVAPTFPSLNLAAAVQILCYELRLAADGEAPPADDHVPAAQEPFNQFLDHLERVAVGIGFLDPRNPRKLMRRLTRLFRRARPDANELNILRGILTAIERPVPPASALGERDQS